MKRFAEQGVVADAMSPTDLGKLYARESAKWAKVIKDAKIEPE